MFVICSTAAYELPCILKVKTNWTYDNVYHCDLASNIESNSTDVVTNISGLHEKGKSFVDVKGFSSDGKILRYFPQEVGTFFKAEIFLFIRIDNAELKEIHQENIAPFIHMQVLSLHTNHIEVIEKNLFRLNPVLYYIILTNNRIKYIAHNVFNHLSLQTLRIVNNTCISDYADTNSNERGVQVLEIRRIFREIEKKCESKEALAERPKDTD